MIVTQGCPGHLTTPYSRGGPDGHWSARGISRQRNQQTTLHWLSPSDPGLAPLKPVRVREYTNVIGNPGKPFEKYSKPVDVSLSDNK